MGPKITRYSTANLVNQLPEDLQRLLWAILDAFMSEMKEPDYLQVFELSIETRSGKPMQSIQHRQELEMDNPLDDGQEYVSDDIE